jgi:PEP-CTERM motif
MKSFVRVCCAIAMCSLCSLLAPRVAQAAPVVQFDVTLNRLCDSTSSCHDVALDGYTLTLVFNEDVVYSFGVDIDLFNAHVTTFGPPSMSITGGGSLTDLPNPFGSIEFDSSGSSLSYSENKQPIGGGNTRLTSNINQQHQSVVTNPDGNTWDTAYWFHSISIERRLDYLTGGDGVTNPVTAADFLHELSIGSFELTWSTQIFTRTCPAEGNCNQLAAFVADPRNFTAFGTATIHAAAEPVPEPTSLVLLASGLMATISVNYLKRSSNA